MTNGIQVEFGWVLSHNSYDSGDHGVHSEHQDFSSLQAFINYSNPIPPPKIHISEWYEHDFIHLETQVSMLLENRQKREERQKSGRKKGKKGCVISMIATMPQTFRMSANTA